MNEEDQYLLAERIVFFFRVLLPFRNVVMRDLIELAIAQDVNLLRCIIEEHFVLINETLTKNQELGFIL